MRVELATKSAKTPVQDAVREIILKQIIPLLLDNKDEFYDGNGDNQTLGQDTAYYNLFNESDGKSAGRIMFSWSPNLWGPKVATEKGKGGKNTPVVDDRVTLLPAEVTALDQAIATLKAAGDIDETVKLMTIKKDATGHGGRVLREDYRVIYGLTTGK